MAIAMAGPDMADANPPISFRKVNPVWVPIVFIIVPIRSEQNRPCAMALMASMPYRRPEMIIPFLLRKAFIFPDFATAFSICVFPPPLTIHRYKIYAAVLQQYICCLYFSCLVQFYPKSRVCQYFGNTALFLSDSLCGPGFRCGAFPYPVPGIEEARHLAYPRQ